MRYAAATVGPLEELAAGAGCQVKSSGKLPLLLYVPGRPRQLNLPVFTNYACEATARMRCKRTFPQEE